MSERGLRLVRFRSAGALPGPLVRHRAGMFRLMGRLLLAVSALRAAIGQQPSSRTDPVDRPLTARERALFAAAMRRALRSGMVLAGMTVAVLAPISGLGAVMALPHRAPEVAVIVGAGTAISLVLALLAMDDRRLSPLHLAFTLAFVVAMMVMLLMVYVPEGRTASLMALAMFPPTVALFAAWGVAAQATWLLASAAPLLVLTTSSPMPVAGVPATDWMVVWNVLLLSGFASVIGSMVSMNVRRRLFVREMQERRSHARTLGRETELVRLNEELAQATRTDPLTGLGNRLRLNDELTIADARAARYGNHCALALLDLDHFKQYNDALGHLAGDAALRLVARILDGGIRETDTACRFGGEEFAIVMPEQTLEGGERAIERIRAAVERMGLLFPTPEGERTLTISAGVAVLGREPGMAQDDDSLLRAADAALYRAKESGRNRVMVSLESQEKA